MAQRASVAALRGTGASANSGARPDREIIIAGVARPSAAGILGQQSVCGLDGERNAERMGFEPMIRFKPYTAFPVRRLRPLGHLSG